MNGRWTWLRQVHGAGVAEVRVPGDAAGAEADAAVTVADAAVLAVHTADCAPVVLAGGGALGVAHAGWRGIMAGVLHEVVTALQRIAPRGEDTPLRALLGPMIRPQQYEFGASDLETVVRAVGDEAAATTDWGTPALDLAAAARAALSAAGVSEIHDLGLDTADDRFFSHRLRGDSRRMVTAARLENLSPSAHPPPTPMVATATAEGLL